MPDQPSTEWHPPQEKYIRWLVQGILGFGVLVGGSMLVKAFVPTIADALALIQKLLANTITTVVTAGILAAVLWVLWETFSPSGKINGLFAQAYSSFIHNMTLELLNVDPMSPLKDSLAAVIKKKEYYDEQFSMFDGQTSKINMSIETYRDKQTKAEKRAKAAQSINDKQAFDQAAYEAGSARDTAENLAKMAARLQTVRGVIVRLQQAAADLIYKLKIDIDSTQVQWDAAQNMSGMEKAARGIISSGGKSDLAREAQQIVQTRYAVAIGQLENLNDAAMPLLQSIDMDHATYSQELLDKWNAEAVPVSIQVVSQPALASSGSFAKLI
jgi:hypothetical protein